jgi:hypothetical protein
MEKIQPIKPSEIVEKKIKTIPNDMIKAVNDLIVKNWNGKSSTVKQDAIINAYLDNLTLSEHPNEINQSAERDKIFENHFLDFEDIYRKAGWKVEYDKPGFNESYEPFFVFKK